MISDTNSASQTFTHEYSSPGEFVINVTAYNLHSDEEYGYNGYTHNMTRVIIVQNPVKDWVLNTGSPSKWLDSNGRNMKHFIIDSND